MLGPSGRRSLADRLPGLVKQWKPIGVECKLVEFPPGVFDDAERSATWSICSSPPGSRSSMPAGCSGAGGAAPAEQPRHPAHAAADRAGPQLAAGPRAAPATAPPDPRGRDRACRCARRSTTTPIAARCRGCLADRDAVPGYRTVAARPAARGERSHDARLLAAARRRRSAPGIGLALPAGDRAGSGGLGILALSRAGADGRRSRCRSCRPRCALSWPRCLAARSAVVLGAVWQVETLAAPPALRDDLLGGSEISLERPKRPLPTS